MENIGEKDLLAITYAIAVALTDGKSDEEIETILGVLCLTCDAVRFMCRERRIRERREHEKNNYIPPPPPIHRRH